MYLYIFTHIILKKQALEAMDVCGHMCGVRYSQINPHRTLKQVREFEAAFLIEKNHLNNLIEKQIN